MAKDDIERCFSGLRSLRLGVAYVLSVGLILSPMFGAVHPWFKEYWIRSTPQGQLVLGSVGRTAELWQDEHEPDGPKALIGRVANVEFFDTSWHDRTLRVGLVDVVSEGSWLEDPNTVPNSSGGSFGPYDLDRIRVVGFPTEETAPLPIGYYSALSVLVTAATIAVLILLQPAVKLLWFHQGRQVRTLRWFIGRRLQWWSKQGVIVGTLTAITGERCWSIRHSFYRAVMGIEGDDGRRHRVVFSSLGLAWRLRLYRE